MEEEGASASRRRIILEFDSTDDPTYGDQQLTMFHGYFDQWQYLSLLVFCQGWPLAAVLRPGNAHDSWGAVSVLRRIVERLWEEFPKARILLRADAGFATPELYDFCEAAGIDYLIGQITNSRLVRRATPWRREAKRLFVQTGEKSKVFGSSSIGPAPGRGLVASSSKPRCSPWERTPALS